jgi:hypothetical protein
VPRFYDPCFMGLRQTGRTDVPLTYTQVRWTWSERGRGQRNWQRPRRSTWIQDGPSVTVGPLQGNMALHGLQYGVVEGMRTCHPVCTEFPHLPALHTVHNLENPSAVAKIWSDPPKDLSAKSGAPGWPCWEVVAPLRRASFWKVLSHGGGAAFKGN